MPEISDEELKRLRDAEEKAKALEANKDRILEESSTYKKRAQEAESKLSEAEKKRLEAEGNKDELLAKEREERQKLEERLKKNNEQVIRERMRSEVAKVAKDAHDVDMILKATEHKELLKIDNENLTVSGVEDFVNKVREDKPYLFGKKRMPTNSDGKPKVDQNDDDITDDRSDDQKFRDDLAKVTSRKEQVEVYKKYGKPLDSFMTAR